MCISGDLEGGVFYSNYITGQVGTILSTHAKSVESIAICENEDTPFAVSCGIDTIINIYSIKEMNLRQKIKAAETGGFTKVQFSTLDTSMVYAASTLGDVIIIDSRNGNLVRRYKGHAAPINDFFEDIHNKWVITAGDDFVCNVYDLLKQPELITE
jgi:WD40 repeat protein